MNRKLSKRIKEIEKELSVLENKVNEKQAIIQAAQEKQNQYLAEVDRLSQMASNEQTIIETTHTDLKAINEQKLMLMGKIDELKGFVNELFA